MELMMPSQELAAKVPDGTSSTPPGQAQRNPYPWAELLEMTRS